MCEKEFDIYNVDHLAAYEVLRDTGAWPEGFIAKIDCPNYLSSIYIQAKMADAWTKAAMEGKIEGIPAYYKEC